MTVLAYESEDGFYPIDYETMVINVIDKTGSMIFSETVSINELDNSYYFSNENLTDVYRMSFKTYEPKPFTFPYDPNVYDYYLLGTLTAGTQNSSLSTWKPTYIRAQGYDVNNSAFFSYSFDNLNVYNIDTHTVKGFGFSERILFSDKDNIGIFSIEMDNDPQNIGKKPAGLIAEFGVLAVDKGSSEQAVMNQILSQLQDMESSINSSIGSAAGQISDSVSDAADQIAGAVEDQYTMSDSEDFGVGDLADQVEEKLGVLTFGADTLNNFLGLFSAETVGGTELTFPAFQIEVQGVSYNVWQDITFDLSFLEERFGVLITAVRTVTVLCVWLAVLGYLVKAKDHFINNKG